MTIEEVVIDFVNRTTKISKYLLVLVLAMCFIILFTCLGATVFLSDKLGGYLYLLWSIFALIFSFTLFAIILIYTCINNCHHIALFLRMENGEILAIKTIENTTCLKIPAEVKGLLKRKFNVPSYD